MRSWASHSLKNVKVKTGFPDVTAVIKLGNWGLSKNVYERFLFSRSFHSPPSHEAARPADFA